MLIFGGKSVAVPGLDSVNWQMDRRCPRATDLQPRHFWTRAGVIHTVKGKKGPLRKGKKPSTRDLTYAQYQANTSRDVSWDYTADTDASVAVSNDPVTHFTWHAGAVNQYTFGVELVQDDDGSTYEDQYTEGFVPLIHAVFDNLGIQKQIPVDDKGQIILRVIERCRGGRTVVGAYAHCNQTANKPEGDPGRYAFEYLLLSGFEGFDLERNEDRDVWMDRQKALGIPLKDRDGIPGPQTVAALKAAGYKHGIWVNGRQ